MHHFTSPENLGLYIYKKVPFFSSVPKYYHSPAHGSFSSPPVLFVFFKKQDLKLSNVPGESGLSHCILHSPLQWKQSNSLKNTTKSISYLVDEHSVF